MLRRTYVLYSAYFLDRKNWKRFSYKDNFFFEKLPGLKTQIFM